jgi:hypothetical protein
MMLQKNSMTIAHANIYKRMMQKTKRKGGKAVLGDKISVISDQG